MEGVEEEADQGVGVAGGGAIINFFLCFLHVLFLCYEMLAKTLWLKIMTYIHCNFAIVLLFH